MDEGGGSRQGPGERTCHPAPSACLPPPDPRVLVEGGHFAYPPLAEGSPAPWVFDGLSLRADSGEWLAVMGASDEGKSTLCLLLAGLAPHLTGGRMEGRVVVAGRDTAEHRPPALADTVGLLLQEPDAQLFNPTVEAEVAWGLENLGLGRAEMRARVDEALAMFRLEAVRLRPPGDLSGGEKKRVALASVLAMRPPILVLDEPMGGLDPAGREELLAALAELRRHTAVTIVMTESDPEAAAAFADRLAILDGGCIALEGTPHQLFGHPDRLTTHGVNAPQMALLAQALNRRMGTAFDFLTVEEALAALVPQLGERGREDERAGTRDARGEGARAETASGGMTSSSEGAGSKRPAVEVEGLWFWYEGAATPALNNVDLCVPEGQLMALVGANGSGKTTLVKHLNGLLRPRRGRVRLWGQDTAGRPVGELARQVGFLFQQPEQQIFSATVEQEVAFGPQNLGLSGVEVRERTAAALRRFGLEAVAHQPPAILGYGVRRRVTLASLAAMDPPILVLDEPTVGLDARGRAELLRWLAELHAAGRTLILVTHDMALVADCAQRAVVLHQGQVLADGPPRALFGQRGLLSRASLARPPTLALARALEAYGLRGTGMTVEALASDLAALLAQGWTTDHGRSTMDGGHGQGGIAL